MDRYLVPVGKLGICAGVLIVCAVILPPGAWWFIVGVALIVSGIKLNRKCCCPPGQRRCKK